MKIPRTSVILKRYVSLRAKLCGHNSKERALFVGSKARGGGGITARSIQRIIKAAAADSGIQAKVSPHSFRHGFIHRLAKKRVPDAVIALMVGHSTTHTVADYTKLNRPELEEAYRVAFEHD